MQKIVINTCYGGFGLSIKAELLYAKKAGLNLFGYKHVKDDNGNHVYAKAEEDDFMRFWVTKDLGENPSKIEDYWSSSSIQRDDPFLVETVIELGNKANGKHSYLQVVYVPDDVEWEIEEYDGKEWIAEKHRTWN